MLASTLTVRELRRRWKPHKERLASLQPNHPTSIRFHRAASWLARIEDLDAQQHADQVLVFQWIAFNCLYGQWNETRQEPLSDRECWRRFLERVLSIDHTGHLALVLEEQKPLVLSVLDDPYLSSFFWQDPSGGRASHSRRVRQEALTWYLERRWLVILERTLDRVYLMRCQLVHGAATCGSKLNRDSLRRARLVLGHMLCGMTLVYIDHGADEDWGPMCYPPLRAVR